MGQIEKIEQIDISNLKPYSKNAKKHGKNQIEKLKASILEFGFLTPCLIDKDFNLIAGHGRIEAAKELNISEVPCVFIEGLTEVQRRAYILADNKLSEIADWNLDLVNSELKELADHGLDISIIGFELDESIEQELSQGEEIDLNSMGDEQFKFECPECGFKFN